MRACRSAWLQARLGGLAEAGHGIGAGRAVGRARVATLTALLLAFAPWPPLRAQTPARADEYRVKAAILFNLAKFVDWPRSVFTGASAPLVLCVLGADPFGSVLDDTLNGRLVGGRPLVAMRITEVTHGCHMLFVTGGERKRLAVIADQLGGTSVLTVGEDEAFTEDGGMISLAVDGERVRFGINGRVAERAGLKVSARLLALAGPPNAGRAPR